MNIDTEIQYKKSLKSITERLVDCVNTDCEPNIDALRTALQVSECQWLYQKVIAHR